MASLKDFEKALADCEAAHRIDSKSGAYNSVAWLLATSPEEKSRDGRKAVEFAKRAMELSGDKDANALDTLAAAYAEAGDFEMAVQWQIKAVESVLEEAKSRYRSRLDLYKSGKPFRDDPEK